MQKAGFLTTRLILCSVRRLDGRLLRAGCSFDYRSVLNAIYFLLFPIFGFEGVHLVLSVPVPGHILSSTSTKQLISAI